MKQLEKHRDPTHSQPSSELQIRSKNHIDFHEEQGEKLWDFKFTFGYLEMLLLQILM